MIKVYKFSTSWCNPCKIYEPVFNKVADELASDAIEFIKVDAEDEPELASKFTIKSVPTTIFEVDGEVRSRKTGNLSESQLKEELNKYL